MAYGNHPYAGYGAETAASSVSYSIAPVSPADGEVVHILQPDFSVTPDSSDGSAMTVEWQWDTSAAFDDPDGLRQIKTTTGNIDEATATTTPDNPFEYRTYYWRARAGDGSSWSAYSPARTVEVQYLPVDASMYFYLNAGFAAPDQADTGLAANEFYLNVGFPQALIEDYGPNAIEFYLNVGRALEDINDTGKADKQFFMNVVSRGDNQQLPPTIN